jgi:hypothetical protein
MIHETGLEHVNDKSPIPTAARSEGDLIYQGSLAYLYASCIQYCSSRITDNEDISLTECLSTFLPRFLYTPHEPNSSYETVTNLQLWNKSILVR